MKPALCSQCKLFQLVDIPEASRIFHNAYPHLTSSSNVVVKHFNNLAQLVREKKMALIDDKEYLTVDYDKMVAVLVEAVKELTKRVEELEGDK